MAWRGLARDAAAAYLRRGGAPARVFSAVSRAPGPVVANPGGELRAFGLFRSPMARRADAFEVPSAAGRHGAQGVWSRSSVPALVRAGAPNSRALPFLVGRVVRGFYPQLSGHKLVKGLGMGSTLAATFCSQKVVYAEEVAEQPSEGLIGPSTKHQISKLWTIIRKYQLPVGLIALIALGWQNPLGLFINVLLILYSSRPSPYSIYLFLQEVRHGEMHQNRAFWKEEAVLTRKVDTKDYKLFSIGTVESADREVLHVIGILGNWWIYRASYGKSFSRGLYWKEFPHLTLSKNLFVMGGRKIGVAVDFSSCSKAALRWASTNLTRSGDQLVLIHVNSSYHNEQGAVQLWEQSGSPLIPLAEFSDPHVAKTYAVSPDKETLEILNQMSNQRGVEVLAKILYGDPAKKLYEAVDLVPLNCLVVGNRGLSTLKRALMGSVSSYIVNNATCPVTVVKENI
uniref:UspA domain-containing protein n=1 Tax=Oryza glumipatula TaxID=40148 RepID=A0A0D9Y3U9_9ORYZ